jgi:hypothetical protein
MGWGTTFNVEIYLNKKVFTTRYELDDKVKEIENYIEDYKKELIAFSTGTPKDMLNTKNDDGFNEHPIDIILRRTSEIFEMMEEYYSELSNLYLLQEYLNENPTINISDLSD